jgi:hypothetical protein
MCRSVSFRPTLWIYIYIYLWSCCICKESSFLGWCNRNANVLAGGYLLPCSRPTQLMSLTFLVTHHSCYERSVGCKCNGKRVIFKILFLCVWLKQIRSSDIFWFVFGRYPYRIQARTTTTLTNIFRVFLGRREKKIVPGSLLRVTTIVCLSVGSPVSVCNGRLNGLA